MMQSVAPLFGSHLLAMVCLATLHNAQPTGNCTTDQSSSDGSALLQLALDKSRMIRGDTDEWHDPKPRVANGDMLTHEEWENKYDFVVKLRITMDGKSGYGTYGCTGIAWGNKVLTAAHCGVQADGSLAAPGRWSVQTATHTSSVSAVVVDPAYAGSGGGGHDFMIVTLNQPARNRQAMALQSVGNQLGTQLMIAAIGTTADGDGNPKWPPRPVVSKYMSTSQCHYSHSNVECIGSGPASNQSSCGADSGGPWLRWKQEACDAWPKSRACAISAGEGHQVGSHTYVDGTGTWCSSANGGQRLSLDAAMQDCASGSFQGRRAPCVGVVFNAPKPGDEGSAYGQYTTCWRHASTGKGWQVLLKPVTTSNPVVPTAPEVAVVSGVNSFGYQGSCGDKSKMTGFGPTAVAHDWIEQVAPGHFHWSV